MNAEHDLVDRVRLSLAAERVRSGGEGPSPSRVAAVVRTQDRLLGDTAVLDTAEAVRRDLVGAGPLQPLLALPGVTDVLVQGPDRVWIDRGAGLELVDVRFDDDAAVRRLAQRLAGTAGRRLDDATPYVDARLSDGTRLHAVLAPVSSEGTCVSLRTTVRRAFTLDQLVQAGSLVPAAADLLDRIVRARLAYVVSGGTGSGKTTLLSTLLSLVPSDERIVVVEDSRELAPDHPHVVHLEARPANLEGAGEICLRTLVRQAMRMRPDRLVVGEVRGAEVVVLNVKRKRIL